MYQFFRKKLGMRSNKPLSSARLVIMVSFIASMLCFPWAYLYASQPSGIVIGLPFVYFLNVLLFPLLVLALLFWYGRKADQADRFDS